LVTLSTPERAASAVGKRPRVELTLWLPEFKTEVQHSRL